MRQITYLSAPIYIWWDITRQCNFQCKHCYSKSATRSPDELGIVEIRNIIAELKTMKVGYVYLLGGEPLIRPDFAGILEQFKEHDIPLMLNTNGWFVDHAWAERIFESTVNDLRFSLDGASAQVHDMFRGKPGSFERVLNGIRICRSAGIHRISCSFTITKMNMHDIGPTVKLLHELGVDAVQFGPISRTGRAREHPELELEAEDTREVAGQLAECIGRYGKHMHIYSVDGTYDRPCTRCVKRGMVKPMFMGCNAGRTCFCLDWDGNVRPCLLWRDVAAGSVRESSLQEIWDNSALFQHLRRHRGEEYPECGDCFYGDVCARECGMSPSNRSGDAQRRRKRIQSLDLDRRSFITPCTFSVGCR